MAIVRACTVRVPDASRTPAHACTVAPVVNTSSTRHTILPDRRSPMEFRTPTAPAMFLARSSWLSDFWLLPFFRYIACTHGMPHLRESCFTTTLTGSKGRRRIDSGLKGTGTSRSHGGMLSARTAAKYSESCRWPRPLKSTTSAAGREWYRKTERWLSKAGGDSLHRRQTSYPPMRGAPQTRQTLLSRNCASSAGLHSGHIRPQWSG